MRPPSGVGTTCTDVPSGSHYATSTTLYFELFPSSFFSELNDPASLKKVERCSLLVACRREPNTPPPPPGVSTFQSGIKEVCRWCPALSPFTCVVVHDLDLPFLSVLKLHVGASGV